MPSSFSRKVEEESLPNWGAAALRKVLLGCLMAVALFVSFSGAPRAQEGAIRPGESFVTRFSGTTGTGAAAAIDTNGTVGSIIDLRAPGQPPQGQHWLNEPQRNPVTAAQVGQIFGVTLDDEEAPNIYVTATSAFGLHRNAAGNGWMNGMWGEGGGPGTVYRLSPQNDYKPEVFATVTLDGRENTGAALGNIAYDRWNKQLFVSDLETGMIHRIIVADGSDQGHFDHGSTARASFFDAEAGAEASLPVVAFDASSSAQTSSCIAGDFDNNPDCWNVADFRRRVWGLGVRQDPESAEVRLYYAVWSSDGLGNSAFAGADENDKKNSIWSIALKEDGSFEATSVVREFFLPEFFASPPQAGKSHPVTDIAFPQCIDQNVMIVSERGGLLNLGLDAENAFSRPHESRTLRYTSEVDGSWVLEGRYPVGHYARADREEPKIRANSSGGVDFGYGYSSRWRVDPNKPDEFVWMTGDALCAPFAGCYNPATGRYEDGSHVHGIQGNAADAFKAEGAADAETAFTPLPAWMVDTDINVDNSNAPIMSTLTRNDATRIGDIAIYQSCEAGKIEDDAAEIEAPPVEGDEPPEIVEPPPGDGVPPGDDELPPDLEKQKTGPAECFEAGVCTFTVTITNNGPGIWSGPLFEHDTLPPGSTLVDYGPQPDWLCTQAGDGVDCEHAPVVLNPGDAVTLTLNVLLPPGMVGQVENCIFDVWHPEGENDDPVVIEAVEQRLNALGFNPGPIDGVLDPQTVTAITDYQNANGLDPTGTVTDELRDALFPDMAGLSGDADPTNDSDCHSVEVIPHGPPPPAPPVIAPVPPPVVPPPPPPPIGPTGTRAAQCDDTVRQGGDQPEAIEIDLGGRQGQATFEWNMVSVKDQMRVFLDGTLVYDTQCVSGTGSQPFPVPPGSQSVRVEVNPNCEGTTSTVWDFKVLCPPEISPQPLVLPTPPPPPPPVVLQPVPPPVIFDDPGPVRCPVGTIRRYGVCVPIIRRCPPGSVLRHDRCVRIVRVCPPGTIKRHGRCITVTRKCPPGTIKRGTRCVQVERHCPKGTVLRNGRCVKTIRKCPEGTALRHGRCVTVARHCPKGTVRRGNRCVKVTRNCPKGTVLRRGRCVKATNPAVRHCPKGTVRRGNRCVRVKPAVRHCPRGTVRRGNKCVRIKKQTICRCPAGTVRRGNRCIRIVKKRQKKAACPRGMVRRGNRCVRIKR